MGLLTAHHTLDVFGVRYELVVGEHALAVLIGLGLLELALRCHAHRGRSPALAAIFALTALTAGALLLAGGRGYLSPRLDVLYALVYGVSCACAYLFALSEPDIPPGSGDGSQGEPVPPWWPQFERDLRGYVSDPTRQPPGRPPHAREGALAR